MENETNSNRENSRSQRRLPLSPAILQEIGMAKFLELYGTHGPIPLPDFAFTEEENRLMDEFLAEEAAAKLN